MQRAVPSRRCQDGKQAEPAHYITSSPGPKRGATDAPDTGEHVGSPGDAREGIMILVKPDDQVLDYYRYQKKMVEALKDVYRYELWRKK